MLADRLAVYAEISTERDAQFIILAAEALTIDRVPIVLRAPSQLERSLKPVCIASGGTLVVEDGELEQSCKEALSGRLVLSLPIGLQELCPAGVFKAVELLEKNPDIDGVCGPVFAEGFWMSHALCWPDWALNFETEYRIALPAEMSNRVWSKEGVHSALEVDSIGPYSLVRIEKAEFRRSNLQPWLASGVERLIVCGEASKYQLFTGLQARVGDDALAALELLDGKSVNLGSEVFDCMVEEEFDELVIPTGGRVYRDDDRESCVLIGEGAIGPYGEPVKRQVKAHDFYRSHESSSIVGPLENWKSNGLPNNGATSDRMEELERQLAASRRNIRGLRKRLLVAAGIIFIFTLIAELVFN